MQQLDDVTGEVIRLSAADKERRMQMTVSTLNAVIMQCNELTKAVNDLRETCVKAERRLMALEDRVTAIESAPSLWTRLLRR